MPPLPQNDLEHVLERTAELWRSAKGSRIFLTGGTGFFGSWLLESCVHANRRLGLGINLVVLTRNTERAARIHPHLVGQPELSFLEGDLKGLSPPDGSFDLALHVATETRPGHVSPSPWDLMSENLWGTSRFLELVRDRGVRRFLFTSSGAVYGPQPADVAKLKETDRFAPDTMSLSSAYGEAKRASELLCAAMATPSCVATVARCFAFVGPRLPLDANYAIGNFIRDAAGSSPIQILGDGTPIRSYLYASDLTAWLLTILLKGRSGEAYNVGSERCHTIREIAECVRDQLSTGVLVKVARTSVPGAAASRYVPNTSKARAELGLEEWVGLPDAIRRTAAWHATPGISPL